MHACHYITLHCIALHYITLHFILIYIYLVYIYIISLPDSPWKSPENLHLNNPARHSASCSSSSTSQRVTRDGNRLKAVVVRACVQSTPGMKNITAAAPQTTPELCPGATRCFIDTTTLSVGLGGQLLIIEEPSFNGRFNMILANSNVPHRNSCLSLFSVINGGCSKALYILYIYIIMKLEKS